MKSNYWKIGVLLTFSLILFIVPLSLVFLDVPTVPEEWHHPMLIGALISGVFYYVLLGIMAYQKNRSVIVWVGVSMMFSPIGQLVSWILILNAKKLPPGERGDRDCVLFN